MTQDELLAEVAAVLDELGIPYLVTGSVASIFFGEPRFTNDIDVVIALDAGKVEALAAAFPAGDFYLSPETARDAVRRRSQFNLLHPRSGLKVDFIVSPGTPFDRSRFARARPLATGPGIEVSFASPEDVILKKLDYHQQGGSDKHLRDVAGILRVSGDQLDRAYISKWAEELGVSELWQSIAAS